MSQNFTDSDNALSGIVSSMTPPQRMPITPIETRLTSALKNLGSVSPTRLVKIVAADLYAEELRTGAGVLDIGLLGHRLFERDILRELKAGDGILWEIKPDREIA